MRIFETDFLTTDEISLLLGTKPGSYKINKVQNPIAGKVIDRLREHFNFEIKDESYWRIETMPQGHGWHRDTGDNNHMLWCQVGVSILLNGSFTGGETYYADDDGKTNVVKQERSIGDLCAHTSDEWHMVTPHEGKRTVFLMFI